MKTVIYTTQNPDFDQIFNSVLIFFQSIDLCLLQVALGRLWGILDIYSLKGLLVFSYLYKYLLIMYDLQIY